LPKDDVGATALALLLYIGQMSLGDSDVIVCLAECHLLPEFHSLLCRQLCVCVWGSGFEVIRLPGRGNSDSHGARPVPKIVSMMK